MTIEIVRVLRVLEYEGPREWVDEQIAKRGVKGTFIVPESHTLGRKIIREAIIGETADVVPTDEYTHVMEKTLMDIQGAALCMGIDGHDDNERLLENILRMSEKALFPKGEGKAETVQGATRNDPNRERGQPI